MFEMARRALFVILHNYEAAHMSRHLLSFSITRYRRGFPPALPFVLLVCVCLSGALSGQAVAGPSVNAAATNFLSAHAPRFAEYTPSGMYSGFILAASAAQEKSPAQSDISPVDGVNQLNGEVVKLYRQGSYKEALDVAVKARELARQTLGEEHPGFADSIDNLAAIYKATGAYEKAEPLLQQALQIRRKALGENDPDFIISLNNLAGLYKSTGKYAEAESLYLKALQTIQTNIGEDNPFYVRSLNNLASLYKSMGDYARVEPLYIKAIDILRKISAENKPDYAIVISNLAQLYAFMGRYSEAESLYRQSLEASRKTVGEQHPQYARTLNNLASLHEEMGAYSKAEPLYRQALDIMISKSGKNSPDAAAALNNLAGLYKTMGDYGKAESLYIQANEIWRAVYGEKHPDFAFGLGNVADLYYLMGKFDAAGKLYEQALQIERSSLGEKHPDVALTMQNLAVLYKTLGRYKEAETLYRQALEIWKSSLGERHASVALSLHNLASLYHAMGRYGEAGPLYRQALEMRTALLGDFHPDTASSLNSLAALDASSSRYDEALELMKKAQDINDRLIRNVFSIASESLRLKYIAVLRGETDAFLSLVVRHLSQSPAAVTAGLDLMLKRKAIVAEATAAERDAILGGRYPDLEPGLRELRTLRIQIAQKTMAGPGPEGLDAHQKLLAKWNEEKDRIEVNLASRIPEINLEKRLMEADRQAVAKALPEDAALVEFVRFSSFDFKAIPAQGQPQWKPARYLAFVMLSGRPDNISLIDLGQADAIDRMISDFRTSITGETDKPSGRGITMQADRGEKGQSTSALRQALFDPILPALSGRKSVFLAPDGNFYRLSFGALPLGEERFIIDDFHICYVGSGRDILRFGAAFQSGSSASLVTADPDYDLAATAQSIQPGETVPVEKLSRDFLRNAPRFDPLPGTRTEGEHIAAMLGVTALVGPQASKEHLKSVRSPRIMHIATHGFFLPDQEPPPGKSKSSTDKQTETLDRNATPLSRAMESPLLRSGLALAGANAWLQGKRLPNESDDGILTGEDASGLDLLATDLVVLSACETGLGDIRVGEGVFGLRRAFLLAGAKTLVMSLWKVPDAQTQMLMEDFYKRILAGRPRAEALREAQLSIREKFPGPFYWGAFICQGDPGPLPSSRQKESN